MKVTVTTDNYTFTLDVPEDLELENFKAFCEVESGLPANETVIVFNNIALNDHKKTLSSYGIREGDSVKIAGKAEYGGPIPMDQGSSFSGLDFSGIQVPSGSSSGGARSSKDETAMIRDMLLANPDQLAILQQNNPALAEAMLSGSLDEFGKVLRQQYAQKNQKEQQKMKLLTSNPFDSEAQRLIAEEIKQKNIEANMEAAIEFNPEIFGTVIMLYINCKVNGHPVKAFIDSGAQATIMSAAAAKRCNIARLIDVRWAGIAKGVGVQRIIGRIHMCTIQIENDYLASSFSVLEQQPMDMLLGLDMLKRHQCSIDLKNNVLIIGTTGTQTQFLTESELPDCARLTGSMEEEQKALEESRKVQEQLEIQETLENSKSESSSFTDQSAAAAERFSENDIAELMKNGFNRQAVIEELRKFNGNKTQALASLFAKSLKF